MSSTIVRPPFAYFGGKQKIAADVAALLADHSHYVAPYAGGLSVLLAKKPSRLETVNDLDGIHFWRMLRNRPEELARACALTPHSRAERSDALHRPVHLDDIERARRIWICLAQGRTGTLRRTGWRFDAADSAHTSMPRRLDGYIRRMEAATARLRSVSLECRPALDVIAAYGQGRRTLMYVDPPYLGEVRERNYRKEMLTEDDHRELASALHECARALPR
uniref:DNA adenine methylase n=1 Tax=Mycolicibacterium obuense TaxID=1807 RepID=UPI003F5872D9